MKLCHLLSPLVIFALISCAPLGSDIRVENETMLSDNPPYAVKFKKAIKEIAKDGTSRAIQFNNDDRRPVVITSYSWLRSTNVDYYYSLQGIAANFNWYYLDSVHFADHEWARVVRYVDKNIAIQCGYMTRKGDSLIYIGVIDDRLDQDSILAFREFKKTLIMPEAGLHNIDDQFAYLDTVAEIVY